MSAPTDAGWCGHELPALHPAAFPAVCTLTAGHAGEQHTDGDVVWWYRDEDPPRGRHRREAPESVGRHRAP